MSHAQYDAATVGMDPNYVAAAIGHPLTLEYESSSSWFPSGTMISQMWTYEADFGSCHQRVSFSFDNVDANMNLGPLGMDDKYRSEYGCAGIVK